MDESHQAAVHLPRAVSISVKHQKEALNMEAVSPSPGKVEFRGLGLRLYALPAVCTFHFSPGDGDGRRRGKTHMH